MAAKDRSSSVSPLQALLLAGAALAVGAVLSGGLSRGVASDDPNVILVNNGAPANDPVVGTAESLEVEPSDDVSLAGGSGSTEPSDSGGASAAVAIATARIPTFDWASGMGVVLVIIGLGMLVGVGALAIANGGLLTEDQVRRVVIDDRPEMARAGVMVCLLVIGVGVFLLLASPLIESALDADHLRYVPAPAPAASAEPSPSSATASPQASQSPSPAPSQPPAATASSPIGSVSPEPSVSAVPAVGSPSASASGS